MAIKIHDIQRMIISRPGFRLDMVKVTVIRDDDILRCSEGNRVWYRLWINPEDMMRIEPLLEGGDRIWCGTKNGVPLRRGVKKLRY